MLARIVVSSRAAKNILPEETFRGTYCLNVSWTKPSAILSPSYSCGQPRSPARGFFFSAGSDRLVYFAFDIHLECSTSADVPSSSSSLGQSSALRHRNSPLPVLHRETGGIWRRWRIPKWRAAVDEDGHYSFAVPL
jgi:hypothetical protein